MNVPLNRCISMILRYIIKVLHCILQRGWKREIGEVGIREGFLGRCHARIMIKFRKTKFKIVW